MLGRKNYTHQEIDQGKKALDRQLTSYKKLAKAVDDGASTALESFNEQFFNNMTLVMDRYFVHRLPGADYEGKDGNPLNEVRLIVDSLVTNNGIMRADTQIKLTAEGSVLGISVGDPIKLSEEDFERLSKAFFTELKRRFLQR
jgi:hypothetical protein